MNDPKGEFYECPSCEKRVELDAPETVKVLELTRVVSPLTGDTEIVEGPEGFAFHPDCWNREDPSRCRRVC